MQVNTLILGAGAAGLFCAGRAGPDVLVVDHAKAPGEKIRISGGGRCNFTNLHTRPEAFLSANPHFHKSALAGFSPQDFLALVDRHRIAWHEKTLGQLFCDHKATEIITMLLADMAAVGAQLWTETIVGEISHDGTRFRVDLTRDGRPVTILARNLVIATGGKSIPKMGATGLAYQVASQFGLRVTETRAGLVPFTFSDNPFAALAGVAHRVVAAAKGPTFDEAMLFTHRGLSGPAMLQVSNYWREGQDLALNLLPGDAAQNLNAQHTEQPARQLGTALARLMPARLVDHLADTLPLRQTLGQLGAARLANVIRTLSDWTLRPTGTEGYRTAEVTLGGVDTRDLSSATMMTRTVPGLYFIGECVDVTGWLGGYNFQWAWASAHAAGSAIARS